MKQQINTYPDHWSLPHQFPQNAVWVYGANPQYRHGLGSALHAVKHFGAIYGKGKGLIGNSLAIITKDLRSNKHPSIQQTDIVRQIEELYEFANNNKHLKFFVCYVGSGTNLNGYYPQQMANMFVSDNIPDNIFFKESFHQLMIRKVPTREYTFDDLVL